MERTPRTCLAAQVLFFIFFVTHSFFIHFFFGFDSNCLHALWDGDEWQRERAAKMKLSDFSDYFHLPIDDAAKEVNLCPTVVKKICRKEGLARWPHRKVPSSYSSCLYDVIC